MANKYMGDFSEGRKNNFDLIRFLAAGLVILSHAYPLSGNGADPLEYVSKNQFSFGSLGVAVFFMVSGFLIAQSWERKPRLIPFLKKRALRLLPGLIVVVAITALLIGPLFTVLPLSEYWQHRQVLEYFKNILLYDTWYDLPGVFGNLPFAGSVNGSLWTLTYEVRCYLILALLGMAGVLRYKQVCCYLFFSFFMLLGWNWISITLAGYFFAGTIVYLLRKLIPLNNVLAFLSLLAIVATMYFGQGMQQAVIIYGSYLVFYCAFNPRFKFNNFAKYGDFSYGLYIYAFPIQQIVVYYGQKYQLVPWEYFCLQFPLILLAAIISWHFVEKPCLKWK